MVLPPRFRQMGGPSDSWLTPCIDSATLRRTLGIASRMPTSESDRLTMNRHSFDLMYANATHHPLCSLTCQASPSVQSEIPSRAGSLMRNCPGTADRAGKPPRLGSPDRQGAPEGGNPRRERAGGDEERDSDLDDAKHGRKASDAHEPVHPAHQRAVGDERANPFGLVSRELHEANPAHDDHQAVAGQLAADRLRPRTQ